MAVKNKVIILGTSTRSAVYVARQLHKHGIHTSVIDWTDGSFKYSKYFDDYFNIGSPSKDLSLFVEKFLELLKQGNYSAVIPIHDPAMEICQKYFSQISQFTKILGLNVPSVYEYAYNKWSLLTLAQKHELKTPESILIKTLDDFEQAKTKINYPCVVKPVSSARIVNNKIVGYKVSVVNDEAHLTDMVREYVNNVNLILQQFVEGYGIGYNIIAKNGNILNAYIHRRISEHKGISSYRESLPVTTYGLKENIESLVKSIGWTGVAMVEFKIQDGTAYLMEMNGRFWGSIEVAIRSGLNFPIQIYEMLVNGIDPEKNLPIRLVKVRNIRKEIKLMTSGLLKGKVKPFLRWLFSLRKSFSANEFIEDSFFDDPIFFMALYYYDLKRSAHKTFRNINKKFIRRKTIQKISVPNSVIAFVCHGNICRSPFAELYVKKNFLNYKFISLGTYDVDNRMSPVNAINAAAEYGIDMSPHLSHGLNKKIINDVEFFVVMDKKNYMALKENGVPKEKIYFLSDKDIPDPYGKKPEDFITNYKIISQCLENFLS